MVRQELDEFLTEGGYDKIPSNLPEFTIYYKLENHFVNVLHVIDYKEGIYISTDQYTEIKDKIIDMFTQRGINETHILSLILCNDMEKAVTLSNGDGFCWLIHTDVRELIVSQKQVSDFYGLRRQLEAWLLAPPFTGVSSKEAVNKQRDNLPIVTILIVLANVLVFLICTMTGDLLYNKGALVAEAVIYAKQPYRLLTGIFLHWDFNHLVSNMLILYFAGEIIEKKFGRISYLAIFFCSGIFGNVLSIIYEMNKGVDRISAGASGAVYGIIGCLLFLTVLHGGHYGQMTLKRMVLLLLYLLYSGFVDQYTNNAAHLGGLAGGIFTAFLIWFFHDMVFQKLKKQKKIKNNDGGQAL